MTHLPLLPSLDRDECANADAVKAWRKATRQALLRARLAIDDEAHARWSAAIERSLDVAFGGVTGIMVSLYWPYQREFDPRPLAASLRTRGATCALPAVVAPKTPLSFRPWRDGDPLEAGAHGIPVPAGGREVLPDVVLAPLTGFDGLGYRLGYGTGYFDRTLAALGNRPVSVGIGFELQRLDSICPQAHDVALDFIVTERGISRTVAGGRLTSGELKDMRRFGLGEVKPRGA